MEFNREDVDILLVHGALRSMITRTVGATTRVLKTYLLRDAESNIEMYELTFVHGIPKALRRLPGSQRTYRRSPIRRNSRHRSPIRRNSRHRSPIRRRTTRRKHRRKKRRQPKKLNLKNDTYRSAASKILVLHPQGLTVKQIYRIAFQHGFQVKKGGKTPLQTFNAVLSTNSFQKAPATRQNIAFDRDESEGKAFVYTLA